VEIDTAIFCDKCTFNRVNYGAGLAYEPRGERYSSQCGSTSTVSGGEFIVWDGSCVKGMQCFIIQRALGGGPYSVSTI
jgi:hypothetical protein